jgi:photosystem II stability/assembly factor-like uncharacterized protein
MLLFDQLLGSGGSANAVQTQVVIGGERDYIIPSGGLAGYGSEPHAYYVANTQIPQTVSEFTVPKVSISGNYVSPIARDASDTIWVTVSKTGIIYSSTDGITWTPRYQTRYAKIIWHRASGRFVGGGASHSDNGANAAIFYSTDGINWNTNILNHTNGYNTYYEGKNGDHVLLGSGGLIRSSSFLSTTWTVVSSSSGANGVFFQSGNPVATVINYGGTDYEIIAGYTNFSANSNSNNFLYSTTGTSFTGMNLFTGSYYPGTTTDANGNWTGVITNANNNGRGGSYGVIYGYTKNPNLTTFIPFIYSYAGGSPTTKTSYFRQSTFSYAYSSPRSNRPLCGAYSPQADRWVLAGDGGEIWWATSTGIGSTNGQAWNLVWPGQGSPAASTNAAFRAIGSSNAQGWVAISENGTIYKTPSISNTTSWTLVANVSSSVINSSASYFDREIRAAAWNSTSNSFVLAGYYGVGYVTGTNNLTNSLRFQGFVGSTNGGFTYSASDTSINTNGKYVSIYTESPNSSITGSGTDITISPTTQGNTAAVFNSVTPWTGIYYYVVGNGGTVYKYNYSASVGTFVSKTSGTAANLNSITGNSTIGLYAVGDAGAFIYSADGETFSTKSLGAPFSSANLKSVAYGTTSTGSNICVFVGTGGVIGYVDVTTFASIASNPVVTVTSGTSANLNSVKWTGWGNNWFTVGDSGTYLYSNTDATTWTSVSIGATGNLYVVA